MPKQMIIVYLGVVLEQSSTGTETKKGKTISTVVLVVTFLITILAAWWILLLMSKAKPEVMRQRRKARAMKDWELGKGSEGATDAFNPNDSDEELAGYPVKDGAIPVPLSVQPQRWDAYGRAIPLLYDPPQPGAPRQRLDSGEYVDWDVPMDPRSESIGVHAPRPKYATESSPLTSPFANNVSRESPPAQQQQSPPPTRSPPPNRPNFYSPPPGRPPLSESPEPSNQAPPFVAPTLQPPISQPIIPANVPRYQLHDGPAPTTSTSTAPAYHQSNRL